VYTYHVEEQCCPESWRVYLTHGSREIAMWEYRYVWLAMRRVRYLIRVYGAVGRL
jgi:hypothetical protein